MRGIDVVQIPTTVQAQLDAAVGGKTGVNLRTGKNLIGTFHQPRAVLVDLATLSTLPDREFRAGMYEAVKCGVIGRPELFDEFERLEIKKLRKNLPVIEYIWTGVDLIIVRVNTEGEYVGFELEVVPRLVEIIKVIN